MEKLGFYAMAILQILPMSSEPGKVSLLDMAEQFLHYILNASRAGKSIDQIHIVFEENSQKCRHDKNVEIPEYTIRYIFNQKLQSQKQKNGIKF